ncbi:hypothetical protein CP533_4847 [Ophiocordyceps camponoti-saundersi (nom. inval.)]|nr:hypothetical protein CP533_4847 [Ophiocordyceps camponoti-saundersi (nom. inval.)]
MEHVPNDVIVIESSSDEASSAVGRKRARTGPGTSTSLSSGEPKKRRVGEADDHDAESHGQGAVGASLPKQASSSTCPLPGIVMPLNPPTYYFDSRFHELPAFTGEATDSSWLLRFGRWVLAFCLYNPAVVSIMTPRDALKAYFHYLRHHSDLSHSAKGKARKQANKAIADRQNQVALAKDMAMLLAAAPAADAAPDAASAPAAPVASVGATVVGVTADASRSANGSRDRDADAAAKTRGSASEYELQRRYYPSATDPATMCLYCSRDGHVAAACPHKTCKFCGQTGHWHFACKTRQRCTNCRQLGHATSVCGGARVEWQDETGLACAFCGDKDHLEDECTDVWRTYHLDDSKTVQKVEDIIISCAICASREHYFSECPDRKHPPNPTWTLANRARYVDVNCGVMSIAAESEMRRCQSQPLVKVGLAKVQGKTRKTQVRYSASEDSEDSDIVMLGAKNSRGKKARKVGKKNKFKKKSGVEAQA